MKTVRIYRLRHLPDALFRRIMDGMAESARVWNLCMEMHKQARVERSPWPGKNEFHKATKGNFELYSQSVQHKQTTGEVRAAVGRLIRCVSVGRCSARSPGR